MKIIFYSLIALMVFISAAIAYRVFVGPSAPKISEQKRTFPQKQALQGTEQGHGLSDSVDPNSTTSIWNDSRLRSGEQAGSEAAGELLKGDAEVLNNLKILKDLFTRNQDAEFLKQINALIAAHPEVPQYVALKGDYYLDSQKLPEAEQAIRELVKLTPTNNFAKTTLASVLAAESKSDEALDLLVHDVVRSEPGNMEALGQILSVSSNKGDPIYGIKTIKELAQNHPENGNLQSMLATILGAEGNLEEKSRVLQQAREKDPENSLIHRSLAEDYFERSDFRSAVTLARTSIDKDPNPQSRIITSNLGLRAALMSKDRAAAEDFVQKIESDDPESPDLPALKKMVADALKKG